MALVIAYTEEEGGNIIECLWHIDSEELPTIQPPAHVRVFDVVAGKWEDMFVHSMFYFRAPINKLKRWDEINGENP